MEKITNSGIFCFETKKLEGRKYGHRNDLILFRSNGLIQVLITQLFR